MRVSAYLAGEYVLTAEETDQFAFRLGKGLGLASIDSIFYPVSFDPAPAEAYANARGQKAVWDTLDRAHTLIAELDNVLAHGTMWRPPLLQFGTCY